MLPFIVKFPSTKMVARPELTVMLPSVSLACLYMVPFMQVEAVSMLPGTEGKVLYGLQLVLSCPLAPVLPLPFSL